MAVSDGLLRLTETVNDRSSPRVHPSPGSAGCPAHAKRNVPTSQSFNSVDLYYGALQSDAINNTSTPSTPQGSSTMLSHGAPRLAGIDQALPLSSSTRHTEHAAQRSLSKGGRHR